MGSWGRVRALDAKSYPAREPDFTFLSKADQTEQYFLTPVEKRRDDTPVRCLQ